MLNQQQIRLKIMLSVLIYLQINFQHNKVKLYMIISKNNLQYMELL